MKVNVPCFHLGYRGDFNWDHYLQETGCRAIPAWAFRSPQKPADSLFRRGMKLEAVDRRNPVLIRVATVADVVMRVLRVSELFISQHYNLEFQVAIV